MEGMLGCLKQVSGILSSGSHSNLPAFQLPCRSLAQLPVLAIDLGSHMLRITLPLPATVHNPLQKPFPSLNAGADVIRAHSQGSVRRVATKRLISTHICGSRCDRSQAGRWGGGGHDRECLRGICRLQF